MNYFAHGMRFTDRPWFLAGTALPDWLSVADRGIRVRSRHVAPFADGSGSIEAELAAGIAQHLHDDQWFHRTRGFVETTAHVAALFREKIGPDDGFRPGFLGHIVTELVLDGLLIEQHPDLIDRYYEVLEELDADHLQETANRMMPTPTERLAPLLPLFRREQFLRDYGNPRRLLYRLNQVLRRIKLKQLPDDIEEVIAVAREVVQPRVRDLLPEAEFTAVVFR